MATCNNIRIVSILLKDSVEELYAAVAPLHGVVTDWTVNELDATLPDEGDVKQVLEDYQGIGKRDLTAYYALQDVKLSDGSEPSGTFPLPVTSFPVEYALDGPLYAPLDLGARGFGINLVLQKITLFCQNPGTAGNDLILDIKKNGMSICIVMPSIPVNSGENFLLIVDMDTILDTAIAAGDVISAQCVSAPDDAESMILTLWVMQ